MWDMEDTLRLIEDIHSRSCLWDVHSVDYKNRTLKYKAFDELSEKYGVTPSELEKKIQSLKSQFRREYKKALDIDKNTDSRKQCIWFGYKPLLFLVSAIEERHSNNTADGIEIKQESTDYVMEQIEKTESIVDHEETESITDFPRTVTQTQTRSKRKWKQNEKSENSCEHCMETLIGVLINRDEFSIYGEHIANKLRNYKRDSRAVSIAQHHMDNIIFNLAMGAYSKNVCDNVTEFNDTN